MDIYLVFKDNPAAISLAKKLSEAKSGDVIQLSDEEMRAYDNGDLIKVPPINVNLDNSNPDLQVVPLDLEPHGPTYLIIAKHSRVFPGTLRRLKEQLKDKVIIAPVC